MSETQLFYLTIMVALLTLYLIINRICELKELITEANTIMTDNENTRKIVIKNREDLEKLTEELDNIISESEEEQ